MYECPLCDFNLPSTMMIDRMASHVFEKHSDELDELDSVNLPDGQYVVYLGKAGFVKIEEDPGDEDGPCTYLSRYPNPWEIVDELRRRRDEYDQAARQVAQFITSLPPDSERKNDES